MFGYIVTFDGEDGLPVYGNSYMIDSVSCSDGEEEIVNVRSNIIKMAIFV